MSSACHAPLYIPVFYAPKTFWWHKVDDGRTPTWLKVYRNIRSVNNSNNPNMFATKAVVMVPRRSNRSMWGRLNPTNHMTIFLLVTQYPLGNREEFFPLFSVQIMEATLETIKHLRVRGKTPAELQPDVFPHLKSFKDLEHLASPALILIEYITTFVIIPNSDETHLKKNYPVH